jgi:hypothetical protein
MIPAHSPRPPDAPDFHDAAPEPQTGSVMVALLFCATVTVVALVLSWWLI